jgi:hypothetical protein
MSGRVCRHNCVVWGSKPTREYLEQELDDPKVNLWWALTYEKVLVQFFFYKYYSFSDMLENYTLPQLTTTIFRFSLDGASVYFVHTLRECLNVDFPGRRIGRVEPITWPPRSPDLKARITAAIANVTARLAVGGLYAELQIMLAVKCSNIATYVQ